MATPSKNLGNLTLHRGGQYAKPLAGAEIAVEREVRERFVALRGEGGKAVGDKSVYHIAAGYTFPTRRLSKLFRRLRARRVPIEAVEEAVITPLRRDLRRVYGLDTGSFRPAA